MMFVLPTPIRFIVALLTYVTYSMLKRLEEFNLLGNSKKKFHPNMPESRNNILFSKTRLIKLCEANCIISIGTGNGVIP